MNIRSNHLTCTCEIRWRFSPNLNKHPVPGLYCKEHNKLIKWLSRQDAFYAIKTLNVEVGRE